MTPILLLSMLIYYSTNILSCLHSPLPLHTSGTAATLLRCYRERGGGGVSKLEEGHEFFEQFSGVAGDGDG